MKPPLKAWACSENPHGLQQAGLEIDIGGGEAVTVGYHLLHERQRCGVRILHRPDHRAKIECDLSLEFAGELLHAPVVHQAADLQVLDAAVARGKQGAFEQRRTDTVALPWLLVRGRRLPCAFRSARSAKTR